MSMLCCTTQLVEAGRGLFNPSEVEAIALGFYEFSRDLLRVSQNKLDIRYILALYHLAVFVEGRNSTGGAPRGFWFLLAF